MIKRFTKGPKNAVGRLNEIIAATNTLDHLVGDGIIKISSTPAGKSFSLDINQLQARIPKIFSGGKSSIKWVTIIRGLLYADPEGDPAEGYDTYLARLTSDTTEAWSLNHGDYKVGDAVTHGDSPNYKYTCIANHDSASYVPGVDNWENVWERSTEIELSAIAGSESTDLRDFVPWFIESETIPVLVVGSTYYILQTLSYVASEGSIRWNEDANRLMAVYK